MFKLFSDVIDLAIDTTKIVTAPARIVVNAAGQIVKPVANALEEVADDLKGQGNGQNKLLDGFLSRATPVDKKDDC